MDYNQSTTIQGASPRPLSSKSAGAPLGAKSRSIKPPSEPVSAKSSTTSRSIKPPQREASTPQRPPQVATRAVTRSSMGAQDDLNMDFMGSNVRTSTGRGERPTSARSTARTQSSRSQSERTQPARSQGRPARGENPRTNNVGEGENAQPQKRKMSTLNKAIFIGAIVFSLGVLTFAIIQISGILGENAASSNEYNTLRETYGFETTVGQSQVDVNDPAYDPYYVAPLTPEQIENNRLLSLQLLEQNSDYWGWLKTSDQTIDYPVAVSEDNTDYLYTSFEGNYNRLGAIFTDCRSPSMEDKHILIHGHNAKDKTMFGDLDKYLDPDHLAMYPTITVISHDGNQRIYDIVSVEDTDTSNFVFTAQSFMDDHFESFKESIGAPATATQVLTLSTCTDDGADDTRFMVHAVLRLDTQG